MEKEEQKFKMKKDHTRINGLEIREEDKFCNKRPNWYAYMVLGLLLIVRTTIIWQQKSFNFIYGFQGEGFMAHNPVYEI